MEELLQKSCFENAVFSGPSDEIKKVNGKCPVFI